MTIRKSMIPVQSCITTVSFPKCWEDFSMMIDKNERPITDLDLLLFWKEEDENNWTAARWMKPGDIIFFYHAAKARIYTKARLKEARNGHTSDKNIIAVLEKACENALVYGGTIFGCAEIISEAWQSIQDDGHFRSTWFADIGKFHLFPNPIPSDIFTRFFKIHQNTITPLNSSQFLGLKELICRTNQSPSYLDKAIATSKTFAEISKSNWQSISCSPEIRFRDESELREYFLDYLLNEIKDNDSPLLMECECWRDGASTGFADYMVQINNRWIPLEAKLNSAPDAKTLSQISKYQNIDYFVPTKGKLKGKKWQTQRTKGCLLADQNGIYFAKETQLAECSQMSPLLSRVSIPSQSISSFREKIISLVSISTGHYFANDEKWDFSIIS